MKIKHSLALLILGSTAASNAATIGAMTSAELSTAIQAEVKKMIKIVDPMKILQGLDQWTDEQTKMQSEGLRRKTELEKMAADIEKKKTELMNMGNTAKKEVRDQKESDAFELQNKFQVKQKQAERAMQEMYEKAQMDLYKEIEASMHEVAQEMGIAIVQAGGVLYADPSLDISDVIVKRMNKKYNDRKAAKPKA